MEMKEAHNFRIQPIVLIPADFIAGAIADIDIVDIRPKRRGSSKRNNPKISKFIYSG